VLGGGQHSKFIFSLCYLGIKLTKFQPTSHPKILGQCSGSGSRIGKSWIRDLGSLINIQDPQHRLGTHVQCSSVADSHPDHFGKADPDPSEILGRIRIRFKVKGRSRIHIRLKVRFRIRIKSKSGIQIRICICSDILNLFSWKGVQMQRKYSCSPIIVADPVCLSWILNFNYLSFFLELGANSDRPAASATV
jgi:hypothetical protein